MQDLPDDITIQPDPALLRTIDQAALLMNISRSEFVMHVLRLWEKTQNLPLNGQNRLCNLIPDNPPGNGSMPGCREG